MNAADLTVATLGPCRIDSPLKPLIDARKTTEHYVDELDRVLFHDTLGGFIPRYAHDGTLRGAMSIAERVRERGGRIAVVGIPKTIDNDIF